MGTQTYTMVSRLLCHWNTGWLPLERVVRQSCASRRLDSSAHGCCAANRGRWVGPAHAKLGADEADGRQESGAGPREAQIGS
jgi:hypothetical protein